MQTYLMTPFYEALDSVNQKVWALQRKKSVKPLTDKQKKAAQSLLEQLQELSKEADDSTAISFSTECVEDARKLLA